MVSWTRFHRRGEVPGAVVAAAVERGDGVLPTEVPGVTETFADELDLIGALQLKWHARLSGNSERAFVGEPVGLEPRSTPRSRPGFPPKSGPSPWPTGSGRSSPPDLPEQANPGPWTCGLPPQVSL